MQHPLLPWIQIPVEQLQRAAIFYRKVFDVTFFFDDFNDIAHAVFEEDSNGLRPINGALVEIKKGEKLGIGPILFFDANDRFEAILEAIPVNGGKVLRGKTLITKDVGGKQTIVPNTLIDNKSGYYAHFQDSEGNRMGLYGA